MALSRVPRRSRPVLRWMAAFVWPYRWKWLGLLALSLFMIGFGLVDPLIMKFVIDDVVTTGRVGYLLPAVLLFLAAKLASLWFAYAYGVAYERFVQRVILALRHELFERIEYKRLHFFKKREIGDLIRLLTTDVWSMRQLLSVGERVVINGLRLVIIAGLLAYLNWRIMLLVFAVSPLYAFLQFAYLKRLRLRAKHLAERDVRLLNFFTERLSHILLIKLFSQEHRELRREGRLSSAWSETNVRYLSDVLRSVQLIGAVGVLAVAMLLWYGGFSVFAGALTVGGFVAVYAYTVQLFEPIAGLVSVPFLLQETRVSMERIADLLAVEEEAGASTRPPKLFRGEIEFRHVTFAYPERPEKTVLRDVSFTIAPGERVAVIGGSGAGKSTLAYLLLGLYQPTRGEILLDGVPVSSYPLKWLRSRISFAPQGNLLFPGSIHDNIAYARPSASEADVERAARMAGIHERITRLPDGYRTRLGSAGGKLSEGEKQRVSLARAFLRRANVYLMDEPSSALDPATERRLKMSLRGLPSTSTVLVITHRTALADFADRVLTFERGRLVADTARGTASGVPVGKA